MKKMKILLKAAIVIAIAMVLVVPSSIAVTNDNLPTGATRATVKSYIKANYEGGARGANVPISFAEGDDRLPSVTMDDQGHTVVAYTNEEDLLTWNMGIGYALDPEDPGAWNGYIIKLSETEMVWYSDVAYVAGPGPEDYKALYGGNFYWDTDQVGGFEIFDITQDPGDPLYWSYFYWSYSTPDPVCRAVEDCPLYEEPYHHPGSPGPVTMAIYHWMESGFDIPNCPIYTNQDPVGDSTTFFFDAQANLKTAPAYDCDLATNLPNWFHLTWQYYNETEDANKIVWKKIDPAVEADIEFVPADWQEYRAIGTNPSIEAYDDGRAIHVAIVYMDEGAIKCVYSHDDGEEWEGPVTVAGGEYPALRAIGNRLYCAYIDDGNLWLKTSENGGMSWSAKEQINDEDGTVVAEENAVDIHPAGIAWVDDRNGDLDIYYSYLDIGEPPEAPDIDGETDGDVGTEYEYEFTADDPDEDDIAEYIVNWGDGSSEEIITGPFASGETATAKHTYATGGDFTITAKAKDTFGQIGPEGTLDVTMPRGIFSFNSMVLRILERFPHAFPLLRNLLGL